MRLRLDARVLGFLRSLLSLRDSTNPNYLLRATLYERRLAMDDNEDPRDLQRKIEQASRIAFSVTYERLTA